MAAVTLADITGLNIGPTDPTPGIYISVSVFIHSFLYLDEMMGTYEKRGQRKWSAKRSIKRCRNSFFQPNIEFYRR